MTQALTSRYKYPSACLACCRSDLHSPPPTKPTWPASSSSAQYTEYDSAQSHANHVGSGRNQCRAPTLLAPLRTLNIISKNLRFLLTNNIRVGNLFIVAIGMTEVATDTSYFMFLPLRIVASSASTYPTFKRS